MPLYHILLNIFKAPVAVPPVMKGRGHGKVQLHIKTVNRSDQIEISIDRNIYTFFSLRSPLLPCFLFSFSLLVEWLGSF